jgi:hypothetical protein
MPQLDGTLTNKSLEFLSLTIGDHILRQGDHTTT